VREALHGLQLAFRRAPGLVADGRDMGTVIFPDATLKVFLTASPRSARERRHKQLISKGIPASIDSLRADLEARDARDKFRSVSPLKPARMRCCWTTRTRASKTRSTQVLGWWQQRRPFGPGLISPGKRRRQTAFQHASHSGPQAARRAGSSTSTRGTRRTHARLCSQLPPGTRKSMSQTQTHHPRAASSFAALFEESSRAMTCASARSSPPKSCASSSTTSW
jgi:hypothetical protein